MPPYAFFHGKIVPLSEAKIGVMTHAFNYGTAAFEGIRGNWSAENKQMYLFRMKEHYERLFKSCRVLHIKIPYTIDELLKITLDVVEKSGYQEDLYVRPLAYKGSEVIGVRLHNLEDHFLIFVSPFGNYLDVEKGIKCCVSSWRRIDDTMIPPAAKITGLYVNSALAKTEAIQNGFDEAILLSQSGHVSEGSGENIFLIIGNKLITPPPSDCILLGITRQTVMEIAAKEMGIETVERSIGRSELYTAEECFLTGTAAHLTPVLEIDRRPVGNGQVGPITGRLQKLYFDILRGHNKKYIQWCTPVYNKVVKV